MRFMDEYEAQKSRCRMMNRAKPLAGQRTLPGRKKKGGGEAENAWLEAIVLSISQRPTIPV